MVKRVANVVSLKNGAKNRKKKQTFDNFHYNLCFYKR